MCLSAISPHVLNSVAFEDTNLCNLLLISVETPHSAPVQAVAKTEGWSSTPARPVRHTWAVLIPGENSAAELSQLLPPAQGVLPAAQGVSHLLRVFSLLLRVLPAVLCCLWELQSRWKQLPQSEIRSHLIPHALFYPISLIQTSSIWDMSVPC